MRAHAECLLKKSFQEKKKKKSYMNGSVCAAVPEDFGFEFGCTCPIHIDKHLEPLNVLHFRAVLDQSQMRVSLSSFFLGLKTRLKDVDSFGSALI